MFFFFLENCYAITFSHNGLISQEKLSLSYFLKVMVATSQYGLFSVYNTGIMDVFKHYRMLINLCNNTSDLLNRLWPVVYSLTFVVLVLFFFALVVSFLPPTFLPLSAQGDNSYVKDRWCMFDGFMVFFIWVSLVLQVYCNIQVVHVTIVFLKMYKSKSCSCNSWDLLLKYLFRCRCLK